MKNKLLVLGLIGVMLLSITLSTANASVNDCNRKATATGAGLFVHEHEGMLHNHYFVFSVSEEPHHRPSGSFKLLCTHDGQFMTAIVSTKINSFSIEKVPCALKAEFSGEAWVKMGDMPWQKGWTFTVTAFDYPKGIDSIGVTLFDPNGQMNCTVEPTPLTQGKIVITK